MYIYMCPSLSISVHNDIEMKGDPDTVSLPIPNCIAKDIFSSAIKEEDERNIFGIVPAATADYAVVAPTPASQDHESIEDSDDVDIEDDSDENRTSAGGGRGIDENVVSSECNNNKSSFNNNNNNNNNTNNLMKRKLKDLVDEHAEDEYGLSRPPPKRVSPFLNTPKQRKDERKRILRLSVYKLREMEDPESFLRKSVLVNNVLRRLHKEIREEKRGYAGFGLGSATMAMSHPYYRPRRFDYDMLNNSHLPTRSAFFFDEPCFPGETEKITDDMTDSLVRSLEASSPPLSPVPTPPPSPSPTSNFLMSTPAQSPLTLSPLLSSSSSSASSTLHLPGSPHPGIPSASTPATSSLISPLTTTTTDDSILATTAPASAITTIITTTSLPSQLSSTTASTRIPSTSEEMLLANDPSPTNTVSISTNASSFSGNSTVLADVRTLSSRITQNGITISRCNTSLISNCSNSLSFINNKATDTSRTIKRATSNNAIIAGSGCSTINDNNNNNDTVCNANGSHVFGTSGTADHAIAPMVTSRTTGLNNNASGDITSTNSPVLFSTTNFGTSGFVSVSGLTPNSFSCFVSSTTTTTTPGTMITSSANSMSPSIAFPEKQLPVEMDTMFNNLISVLGET